MAPLESAADEVTRLRDCLNDLVSITALPALSTGVEPGQIVSTLLDALLGTLRLAFACVRLNHPEGGTSFETVRVAGSLEETAQAREISEAIDSSLGDAPTNWPPRARVFIGDVELSVASAHLGLQSEVGGVVAGSQRRDFPSETERLLLDVAANQAAIGLQHARLLSEQKRLASGLDERVAWRTSELAAANQLLKKEVAERLRTEDALRESERESRLIVDSIPGFVSVLTPAGEVEFVNRPILEYFGRTLEELKRWGTGSTIHPEDLPRVVELFTHSIASGEPFEFEVRARRFDGAYRWFQSRGFPLLDTNGHIVRWYNLLIDIDERKRAEEALRESERESRLIADTIPGLVAILTPGGEVDVVNNQVVEYCGQPLEAMKQWGTNGTVHSEDLPRVIQVFTHAITSGDPYDFEARIRRFDGVYRWFQVRGLPLRDASGQIARWYVLLSDIDDRKRAEAELRRAYDHMIEVQRLSQTGSFTSDLEGDEHYWSDEFYRICEFDPGSKITIQRLGEIVHPEDVPLYEDAIGRSVAGANPEFGFRIVTSRGVVKHLRGFAHRITDRPVFVGALQDVTEKKNAEEALNKARSELAHVARVTTLNTLTASIAHEVNQPLSGIITNASTCLRMLDANPPNVDGARETSRRTIRDGNRASDVIIRLRALFSKKEFSLESLDLNEATREVIALSLSELQRNRIVLQSELADDLPNVTGDRIQLQQVIHNLLRNASDAMVDVHDRPRQLLIRTEREHGDRVRVSVRDAGVGLDRQSMDKLFNAFFTTKSDGMGIGLSVSRSIVERHHGRLWAEPNDGPGATFSLSIPRGPESVTDARGGGQY